MSATSGDLLNNWAVYHFPVLCLLPSMIVLYLTAVGITMTCNLLAILHGSWNYDFFCLKLHMFALAHDSDLAFIHMDILFEPISTEH